MLRETHTFLILGLPEVQEHLPLIQVMRIEELDRFCNLLEDSVTIPRAQCSQASTSTCQVCTPDMKPSEPRMQQKPISGEFTTGRLEHRMLVKSGDTSRLGALVFGSRITGSKKKTKQNKQKQELGI